MQEYGTIGAPQDRRGVPACGTEISVVIPVFNEAANVRPLIAQLRLALADRNWEVLFVDDNSPDGTAEIVREESFLDDRIRLILRVADRGLARAAVQGLLSAKADLLCVMDGDGQHNPAVILDLLPAIEGGEADIVSAARSLNEPSDQQALGAMRLRLSRLGNRMCEAILGRHIRDPLTGFFAIRRDAFLAVAPRLGDPGFKILLDILATDDRLRHREVDFSFESRRHGESKLGVFVGWQFFVFLIGRVLGGWIPPTAISFAIVGLTGVIVHMAALLVLLSVGASFPVCQLGASLAATTTNFLLNNLLTFSDRRLTGTRLVIGFFSYLAVASVGILASVGVATLALSRLTHFTILAALAGIAIDAVWKYALSSRLVWR